MGDGRTYAGIILFILFLIIDTVLYAFKSALENINENEIDKKLEEGSKRAIRLSKIIDSPGVFGDTLDIVVFITNFVAGGYILDGIGAAIDRCIENGSSALIYVISGVVMLLILLVFGVLIPKQCGKRSANKTALALAGIARAFTVLLFPVSFIVTIISHMILRIFGINPNDNIDNVTEEEIISMVNEGQEQGVLESSEAEMITNIFELGDKNAGDIMTHRSTIVGIECHMTLEELVQSQIDGNYSRFPVYDGDIDNIVGTIHIRDALILYRNIPSRKKQIANLKTLLRPAYFVPETRDIDDLLKEMQAEKVHMGIVVDEYGQTAGLISMEDIIEEIVGNILDEYDEEEEVIERSDDDTYVVDGLTELEDLNKLLGIDIESDEYETLNGFLISKLDKIPGEDENETVEAFSYCFKILEVSGNVIRKVEITRMPEEKENQNGTDTKTE